MFNLEQVLHSCISLFQPFCSYLSRYSPNMGFDSVFIWDTFVEKRNRNLQNIHHLVHWLHIQSNLELRV